jgi:hypothetical protein
MLAFLDECDADLSARWFECAARDHPGTVAAAVTTPPMDPAPLERRHAYFADPEENHRRVVYLKGDGPGQQAIERVLEEL